MTAGARESRAVDTHASESLRNIVVPTTHARGTPLRRETNTRPRSTVIDVTKSKRWGQTWKAQEPLEVSRTRG